MADIWIIIVPIFCLALLVLLYFLHKQHISTNGESLADTNTKADRKGDTIGTTSPLKPQEPQRPIKAERKNRRKSRDPAQSPEARSEARRQKQLGHEEEEAEGGEGHHYGGTFIEEFDKRDARRKQLKKENEEKLKSLLNWKSPFSDGIAPKNYSDTDKYKRVSFVDRDLPRIKKERAASQCRAEPRQEEFFKLKENPTAQSKAKEKPSPSPAGQEVRKIINFVAISSRQVVEGYKPRNKLKLSTAGPGSETIKQPERVERKRRVPTPTPRKKVKLNSPEVLECSDHVEDVVADIEVDAGEEARATVKVADTDRLSSAAVVLTDTSFNLEKEPPRPSSLEFTPCRRNFITDKLFAGNIYVGEASKGEEQDLKETKEEEEGREEKFSSWRERYQRKMGC